MSKENFEKALEFLYNAEGGYINDKDDAGGATNFGVTQDTYNDYCKKKNLSRKDVKYLTKNETIDFYYEEFWKPCGADEIDDPKLAIAMFDTAVLHGKTGSKNLYTLCDGTVEDFLNIRERSYDNIVAKYPVRKKFLKGLYI